MPISKSAKKALRQSKRKHVRNSKRVRAYKEAVKEVKKLVSTGKQAEAEKLLPKVYKALDKATKTKVLKKNAASRKKSRIAKMVGKK